MGSGKRGKIEAAEHIPIHELSYCRPVRKWLADRYGKEADRIWEKTVQNYNAYLPDLPDYGGWKNGHARAIYGGSTISSSSDSGRNSSAGTSARIFSGKRARPCGIWFRTSALPCCTCLRGRAGGLSRGKIFSGSSPRIWPVLPCTDACSSCSRKSPGLSGSPCYSTR